MYRYVKRSSDLDEQARKDLGEEEPPATATVAVQALSVERRPVARFRLADSSQGSGQVWRARVKFDESLPPMM